MGRTLRNYHHHHNFDDKGLDKRMQKICGGSVLHVALYMRGNQVYDLALRYDTTVRLQRRQPLPLSRLQSIGKLRSWKRFVTKLTCVQIIVCDDNDDDLLQPQQQPQQMKQSWRQALETKYPTSVHVNCVTLAAAGAAAAGRSRTRDLRYHKRMVVTRKTPSVQILLLGEKTMIHAL